MKVGDYVQGGRVDKWNARVEQIHDDGTITVCYAGDVRSYRIPREAAGQVIQPYKTKEIP